MKEESLKSLNNYLFSENERLNAMIDDLEERIKNIEMLNKKIEAQDKIINTQALEIAGLKSIIEKWELGVFSNDEELQQRIEELEKEIELWKKKYGKL